MSDMVTGLVVGFICGVLVANGVRLIMGAI